MYIMFFFFAILILMAKNKLFFNLKFIFSQQDCRRTFIIVEKDYLYYNFPVFQDIFYYFYN